MSIIKLPAKIEALSPVASGGMSIRLKTEEMSAERKAELMDYFKKTGWFLFKSDEIGEEEAPEQDSEFGVRKKQSQRLRGVLYVLWRDLGIGGDFEEFYRQKMDEIIDFWKKEIPAPNP